MAMLRVSCLVFLAALVATGPAWGDDEAEPLPKIGLVLGGGGALGAAHVGVLKVLEELHIPVHCVAGTSMGAIVGGLYAAGVSPADMETILARTDWRDLFDDRPPRRSLPYRRKVDDQTYLTRFEVGFNHGRFQLPPGLITGQKLAYALQALTIDTAGIEDFDRFPIPFRAIATDIETGDMVVLDHGSLGTALRASMSIPAVFSPVEIDDHLLVDGGLVRNLPVDVARSMGADVVIAVDVGQPLFTKQELASLARVTSQMVGIQIQRNVREQAGDADVLIEPDTEGFSSAEFEAALELVPRGEQAARAAAAELGRYSVPEAQYTSYIDRIRHPQRPPAVIASVQLTMSSTADPQLVLSRVRVRRGDPLDLDAIRRDLDRLYETGDYESVGFFLSETPEGHVLHIEAQDKSWGPNYLRFGLNFVADFEGESAFDMLASYTMTQLNRRRGELKLQAQLGNTPTIAAELYQPFSTSSGWFVSALLNQSTSTVWSPAGEDVFARYRVDVLQGSAALGYELGRYGELRLGAVRARGESRLRSGSPAAKQTPPPEKIQFDSGGVFLSAIFDQFDNMNFPRHGYLSSIQYYQARHELGSDADYERLAVFAAAAATHGRHTLLGLTNYYTALDTDSPEVNELSGLFRLSGTPPGTVTGRYGGNATLLYLFRLLQMPHPIGDGLYLGGSIETGNLWFDSSQVDLGDLHFAGSVCIGLDTAFGPVYLAQGFTEHGDTATYLYVGRTF